MAGFITKVGQSLAGYRSTCSFGEESTGKNFIELQYGPGKLEEMSRKGLSVWYWTGRWFKPEQHEEFSASLSPQGSLVGFWHTVEEERALPLLDKAAARALAEQFLKTQILQHPWAALRFKEESTDKRTHRTDYTFTWEREDLRLKDAPYQLTVTVLGNAVGGYGESLKVPERWTRDFARKREVNAMCEHFATYLLLPILVGFVVLFIRGVKNGNIRWTNAVPWGWLVLIAVAALATAIDGFPKSLFQYETTQKWSAFLAAAGFSTLRSVLGGTCAMWGLFLVSDAVYRERLPQHSSFRRALGPMGLRDPETFRALGIGIVTAVFSLAYVTLFYTAGQRCGVWAPVEIDYSKTLGGLMPWAEPMQTGLEAAFSEELLFRVVGLLLIWWIVRVRWVAVLLSAATWAFLHSNYPQMPGYIRGVELTIVGTLWAVLLLRYGLVATLAAHYLYDCWLGSLIVFQSPSWADKAGALIVSLWPVALFAWGWLRKCEALPPEEKQALIAPPPPSVPHEIALANFTFPRLSPQQIGAVLAAVIAIVVSTAVIHQPQAKLGALGKHDLSLEQIALRADALLRQHGFAPEKYRRIVTVSAGGTATRYLLEHGTLGNLARMIEAEWPDLNWHVRYFQVLQREEFGLQLDKRGNLVSWRHSVPREASGAQLDRAAALALAQSVLVREHGVDLAQETLVSDDLTQQEHRRDWRFVFERKNFGWGAAKLRTSIALQGDEPNGFYRHVKVPEAWLLENTKSGWKKFATTELTKWIGVGKGIFFFVLFVLLIRKHLTPWRLAFRIALFPLALEVFDRCNRVPWFYEGYSTTTPPANYLIEQIGGGVLGLGILYLGMVMAVAVALGFMRWAFEWTPADLVLWPADPVERRQFWRDNLVVVMGSLAAFHALNFANDTCAGYWFPDRVAGLNFWNVRGSVLWVSAALEALKEGYYHLVRIGIYAGVMGLVWRRSPKAAWLFLLLSPLLSALSEEHWRGFLFNAAFGELELLLTVFLLVRVWRFNGALIFLVYTATSLAASVISLWEKGGPAYRSQVGPLAVLCLAAVLAGSFAHRGAIQVLARDSDVLTSRRKS